MAEGKLSINDFPNEDVLSFFKKLTEAYIENQTTQREIARIEAEKEVLITEITQKYEFYKRLFDQLFSERKLIMIKQFEIIDTGLETNNRDYILEGLKGLSQLVTTSPFADLKNLSNMLEYNKKIVI